MKKHPQADLPRSKGLSERVTHGWWDHLMSFWECILIELTIADHSPRPAPDVPWRKNILPVSLLLFFLDAGRFIFILL